MSAHVVLHERGLEAARALLDSNVLPHDVDAMLLKTYTHRQGEEVRKSEDRSKLRRVFREKIKEKVDANQPLGPQTPHMEGHDQSISIEAKDPRLVLDRLDMHLPNRRKRVAYLRAIERANADGQLNEAGDIFVGIANVSGDRPSWKVRWPLLLSLLKPDGGILALSTETDRALETRRITSFHGCDLDDFLEHSEALWIARALFSLRGYGFSEPELVQLCFGNDSPTEEESIVFRRAQMIASHTRKSPEDARTDSDGQLEEADRDSASGGAP